VDYVDPPLEEQRRFIERPADTVALLAAGPGTGKTWVLERRSEWLVEQGVAPGSISIVTLTRAMAASLTDRIPHGRASTLHSFALRHLNASGEAWGRKVADPWEVDTLVCQDLQDGYELAFGEDPGRIITKRFLKKMSAAFRDEQDQPANPTAEETRLHQVFIQQRTLFGYRLMDELVYDLLGLLEGGVGIDAPSHLLVDEYQDLTPGELRLLQVLHQRFGTFVNACGDDRQSIYGFRLADPLALHRFAEAYALEEVDHLTVSRRCPSVVCNLANRIADYLPPAPGLERLPIEPWPERNDEGLLGLHQFPSLAAESRWIAVQCLGLLDAEVPAEEVIVIASSFHAPVLAGLVAAADAVEGEISFFDPRSANPLANDVAVRLLGAGLRLLVDVRDQMAWRTLVWAKPGLGEVRRRSILEEDGLTYTGRLARAAASDETIAAAEQAGDAVIDRFGGTAEVSPAEVLDTLCDCLGVQPDRALVAEVLAGRDAIAPHDFATMVAEAADGDDVEEGANRAIAVHTIFSSKGLDAGHVFLATAIDQAFAGRGNAADGIRQLFVGVTRASEALHISAPGWIKYTALQPLAGEDRVQLARAIVDAAGRDDHLVTIH
jgi:superfamily I DNA/RNA helicase